MGVPDFLTRLLILLFLTPGIKSDSIVMEVTIDPTHFAKGNETLQRSSQTGCKFKEGVFSLDCTETYSIQIIKELSDTVQLHKVRTLSMEIGNNVQSLKKAEFATIGLTNVEFVNLANNQISSIEPGSFLGLSRLNHLDLSNNKLQRLNMEVFAETEVLSILQLNGNPLHTLEGRMFPPLGKLRTLELSDCILPSIPKQSFSQLSYLQELKLNGNRLKRLDWDVFQNNKGLTHLYIENNPWHCDCYLRFTLEHLTENDVQFQNSTACKTTTFDQKYELKDFGEFQCPPEVSLLVVRPDDLSNKPADDDSSNVYTEIGKNIAFGCIITAYPAPTVIWLQDEQQILENNNTLNEGVSGQEITKSRRVVTPIITGGKYRANYSSYLKVFGVQVEDAGGYSCKVENSAGGTAKTVNLKFTNLPTSDLGGPLAKGGIPKLWLWVAFMLICLILLASCVICFGLWKKRENKRQKILKLEMIDKFTGSQTIIEDAAKNQDKSKNIDPSTMPLLQQKSHRPGSLAIPDVAQGNVNYNRSLSPEVFSPRPAPMSAELRRDFFARQSTAPAILSRPGSSSSSMYNNDPAWRRQNFANSGRYPGTIDRYQQQLMRRPGSSLSLFHPESTYQMQRPRMTRQLSAGPAVPSYATLRFLPHGSKRPPSTSSMFSEPPLDNFRHPGYVTMNRNFDPPRGDSGFGPSLSPTGSNYSSMSYSTLPRNRRVDPRTGILYDNIGPRTSMHGGSTSSLNKLGVGSNAKADTLDSISKGLDTPTSGKVKSARARGNSSTTPGSLRGRNDFFSFEPIEEIEGSEDKLEDTFDLDKILPKVTSPTRFDGNKLKKKPPPQVNIPSKTRKPIKAYDFSRANYNAVVNNLQNNQQQRPFNPSRGNINDLKNKQHRSVEETSIDDTESDVGSVKVPLPPPLPSSPPPKPHRLQNSLENIFDARHQTLKEIPGTEV